MEKHVTSPIGRTVQEGIAARQRGAAYRAAQAKTARAAALAKHVIHLRTEQGLTQARLAARMRTSHTFISRLESGRHDVSQRTYDKVFRALGAIPLYGYELPAARGRPARRELVAV